MTSDLDGFKGGQLYKVPLHDNNRQYTTISTGLIRVQPESLSKTMVDYISRFHDPEFPPMTWDGCDPGKAGCKNASWLSVNGCPLSSGANRTYALSAGDYVLETLGVRLDGGCSSFNVKMSCGHGAEAASPIDSDPLGFTVDANTGAITGTPQKVRGRYRLRLRAVDAEDRRTDVAEWTFSVKPSPDFSRNPLAGWSDETDGKLESKYHVAETHLLPKPRVATHDLLQYPAGGRFDQIVYLLSAEALGGANASCAGAGAGANSTRAVSALTDVATGEGAINIKCAGSYNAKLIVRDGAGKEVTLRSWNFTVRRRDVDVPEYGPGGRGCTNGLALDGELMDGAFTCDCGGTKFTGDNCAQAEAARDRQDDTVAYSIGAVLAVLTLAVVVVVLLLRWQSYQRSMMATDFFEQLAVMKERGEVDESQALSGGIPRELKRTWLALIDKLGHGAFGDVWKGLIRDGDNPHVPECVK